MPFPHKNSELPQKWIQAVKRKKTGYKTNTALSVVATLNHPLLLSDQEKLGADCMTIQFQKFPFLSCILPKRAEEEKTASEMQWLSPQKSCEPSPSKVVKVFGSEHSYASATNNAHSEVKQLKKIVKILKQKVQWQKKKNSKHGRAYEKPKRQTTGFQANNTIS